MTVKTPLNRYAALRKIGFGPVTALMLCFINFIAGTPPGYTGVMHVLIDHTEA